jgi:hypothetical protein
MRKWIAGDHRSPYADIPFPEPVPSPPPRDKRHILVVVLPGFAPVSATVKLLQYLGSCPDSIDVAVANWPAEV